VDVYQCLQERLDLHASGAPASEHFTRILKIMFSPEEAKIACELRGNIGTTIHSHNLGSSNL
jgi:hypothetical protein